MCFWGEKLTWYIRDYCILLKKGGKTFPFLVSHCNLTKFYFKKKINCILEPNRQSQFFKKPICRYLSSYIIKLHFSLHVQNIYLTWNTVLHWSEVKSLSHVRLFATPWTVAKQAPQSMEFSRGEDWSGLPFPSPGDLPNPGIEPRSPTLQADALPSEPPEKPSVLYY